MSATPVVPGLLYLVKHNGHAHIVFARNPVDALLSVVGAA